jgi:hypothetical protein
MEPTITIALYDAKAILTILKLHGRGYPSFVGRLSDAINDASSTPNDATDERPGCCLSSGYYHAADCPLRVFRSKCTCHSTDGYHSDTCPRCPTDASHRAIRPGSGI